MKIKALLFFVLFVVLSYAVLAPNPPADYTTEQLTNRIGECIISGCDNCDLDPTCLDLNRLNWEEIAKHPEQFSAILKTKQGREINFNENPAKRKALYDYIKLDMPAGVTLNFDTANGDINFQDGVLVGSFGRIDLTKYWGQQITYDIKIKDNTKRGNIVTITPKGKNPVSLNIPEGVSGVSFNRGKGGEVYIDMTNVPSSNKGIKISGPADIIIKFNGMNANMHIGEGGSFVFTPAASFVSKVSFENRLVIVKDGRPQNFGGVFSFDYDWENRVPKDLILKRGGENQKSYYYDLNSFRGFETTTTHDIVDGSYKAPVCSEGKESSPYCVRKKTSTFTSSADSASLEGPGIYKEFVLGLREKDFAWDLIPAVQWKGVDEDSEIIIEIEGTKHTYTNIGKSEFKSPFWSFDSTNTKLSTGDLEKKILKYTATIDYGEPPSTIVDFAGLAKLAEEAKYGSVDNLEILKFSLNYYERAGCTRSTYVTTEAYAPAPTEVCVQHSYSKKITGPATLSINEGSIDSKFDPSKIPKKGTIISTDILYGSENNIVSESSEEGNSFDFRTSGNSDVHTYPYHEYENVEGHAAGIYYSAAGIKDFTKYDYINTPWGVYRIQPDGSLKFFVS